MTNNRGSQFRKWDLHLHSCFTYLNNGFDKDAKGQPKLKEFINSIKSKELSAIGLTNYFNFSDEDFILKESLERQGIVTFLNLEVRLSNVNKANDFIDYHIIFDNQLDNRIVKNLLGELKADIGSAEKAFNLLTIDEIEHKASISFDKLQEILSRNTDLQGRYLTAFLSRGHGSATSESDKKTQTVYETICRKSDFIIHSSCNDSNTCTNKKCNHNNINDDRNHWLNKSKYIKPLLQTSDSHELKKIGSKYSWIKSDLTFEGLKQILFEPNDRISLEIDYPDRKNDYQVIDYIEFENGKKLFLNSALNTIIGGRSTGKSTLTNTIAKTLHHQNFISIGTNNKRGMHVFDENIKIVWRDGQEHKDSETILEFLPQDYMIEIAEDDSKRNVLIRDTVRVDTENFKKIEDYERQVQENQTRINMLIQEWANFKIQLSNLKHPEGDKEGITAQIQKIEDELSFKQTQSNFSEDENKEYNSVANLLKGAKRSKETIEGDLRQLIDIKNQDIQLNVDLLRLTDDTNQKLKSYLKELEDEVNDTWNKKIDTIILKCTESKNQQQIKIQEIENLEIYKKGTKNIVNNKSLILLDNQLKTEAMKLLDFEKFEKDKKSIEDKIIEKQTDIIESYAKFKNFRDRLQKDFEVKATSVEIKLNFTPIKFEEKIKYLHGRNPNNNSFIDKFNINEGKVIKTIFSDLKLVYNQGKNQDDLIRDLISQQWFTINYTLLYENDDFEQMSQGKKAFVILSLILEFSNDKRPVIIDQPEDSLDNRAIYNDLTIYLKNKKKERQIILVTHNPNIVVGADAENIIVANKHSDQDPNENNLDFDYINGSLESSFTDIGSKFILKKQGIRQHVIEILEGGYLAFEKREQKYK